MVSKKEKIKKLIKKLKGKKVPKKKKPTQKQKQKQSVIQNVRISAPQQSQRAVGFPTQVIQTPSSDTEFLRSIIQQQTQNNLTRMYEAKNPQQGMRLDDQIGLSSQRAFPNPPPAEIEATIPQAQTPVETPSKKPRTNWKGMSMEQLEQLTTKGTEIERKTAKRQLNKRRNELVSQKEAELKGQPGFISD
tara:strand:- start:2359 stop:2928 length:570 start_codon:yes stop_codon:yes gene_type:complete